LRIKKEKEKRKNRVFKPVLGGGNKEGLEEKEKEGRRAVAR